MGRLILAGDIGGTNARLALFSWKNGLPALEALEVFSSREHPRLESVLDAFLARHAEPVAAACVGIAGPVKDNEVYATNLPWIIEAAPLAARLGLERVELINDLEANAHGLKALGPEDLAVLNAGAPNAKGNMALVAAGTGLGEASLPWNGHDHVPVASEGGHVDFAPRDELEIELLRYLIGQCRGRVSYERVLSGMGLDNIYRFLRDTGRGEEEAWLAEQLADGDRPAVIAAAALAGRSELCARALDLFVSVYGAEAGNVALKFLASGGLYLGGGIAPKILAKLQEPVFMRSFLQKGRLRPFLEGVPVRVILNDKTALLGAARRAFLSFTGRPAASTA